MEKTELLVELNKNPINFWALFNSMENNIELNWTFFQIINNNNITVPESCLPKYKIIKDFIWQTINAKELNESEKSQLINQALESDRSIYSLLRIQSYKHYLFFMKFGDIPKQAISFIDRISLDILNNMSPKHYQEIYNLLINKGNNVYDALKLSFQIYHVLGYFKTKDLLLDKYGFISNEQIKAIFSNIDLSQITYISPANPELNETIINLMLGESFHINQTPIKKYINGLANDDITFFLNNLNLIIKNWDLIIEEYIKRSNLERLELKLNISQINNILFFILKQQKEEKQEVNYRGRKRVRYEKIPNFSAIDTPLLDSDLFDYLGTFNKYVTNPQMAPERAVTISRAMNGKNCKKFPDIDFEYKNYRFYTFNPQDRDIISAGFRTNNCFVPNGQGDCFGYGESLLAYCATNPYGGGLEIRHDNKTLAFIPLLRNGNVLFLYSIEGINLSFKEKKIINNIIKKYAVDVIKVSNNWEEQGIEIVVTPETYNVNIAEFSSVLPQKDSFHIYNPTNTFRGTYDNFSKPNYILAQKDENVIPNYDYPVTHDYYYSKKCDKTKALKFNSNELQVIQEMINIRKRIQEYIHLRRTMIKNRQDSLEITVLKEIKKLKKEFNQKYQLLFQISSNPTSDQFQEYIAAIDVIKGIYDEQNKIISFDINTLCEIYYTDNWFAAIDLFGNIYSESIVFLPEYREILERINSKFDR